MTKYLKGKDGKFTGSIGEGKDRLPPRSPIQPDGIASSSPRDLGGSPETVVDLYNRFVDLSRERESLAVDGIRQTITNKYPDAALLIVEEEDMSDALNGIPTDMIPVQIVDRKGNVLWSQDVVHRESSDFEHKISELAQAISTHRWDELKTDEGFGRRYSLNV